MQRVWLFLPLLVLTRMVTCGGTCPGTSPQLLRLRGGGNVPSPWSAMRGKDAQVAARGPPGTFEVLFLGSGVSTGVPRIGCIVRPDQSQPICKVCHDALNERSRNRRGNVSILVRFWHADGRPRHIMVGCFD